MTNTEICRISRGGEQRKIKGVARSTLIKVCRAVLTRGPICFPLKTQKRMKLFVQNGILELRMTS